MSKLRALPKWGIYKETLLDLAGTLKGPTPTRMQKKGGRAVLEKL